MRARAALLSLLLLAAPGRAQAPPETPPEMGAARGHFLAGKAYFEKGDYRRAILEFREALRESELPEFLYNMARSYDRLGDAAKATEYYERYVARSPQAEDRLAVEARVAELKPEVGGIEIVSRVLGASFQLDEEPVAAGTPFRVTRGRHRPVASKDGSLSRTLEVTVLGGQVSRVELDPIAPQAAAPQLVERHTERVTERVVERPSRWWIGLVVGGGVAAAAGVTLGLVFGLSTTDMADPYRGNVSPGYVSINP